MNFKKFIRSKGLTQEKLADAMGCGRANISLWATGEVFPTPTSINNIVEGFAKLGIKTTYDEVFATLLITEKEKESA
jgi:transcriptional regulator with XRE-family HTH domain